MTTRRALLTLAGAASLAPAFVRHARAADVERFTLGVASGCPRPASVVLWTRVMGTGLPDPLEVRWDLARDEAFRDITAHGVAVTDHASAHSVHVVANGLEASRWYWYRFSTLGARSLVGRTRTAPAPSAAQALNFAIASCQRYDHGHYAAWRHMADEPLDLVLFLGDYIYEYATPPHAGRVRSHDGGLVTTLQQYRDRYAQYKSDAALQTMHARAPWIVVWDDHEVDNDYAGDRSQTLDPAFALRRAAAYQAYWEHMPFAPAARPRHADMRIHDRYDWGSLARIHTLDDRQYRDAQACPRPGRGGSNDVTPPQCPQLLEARRSMLGNEQERWLAEGWSAQHRWNVLAQQTLMARFAWPDLRGGSARHWTDAWDGYPASRRRVLAGAGQRGVANLVSLGGDVHANYVTDLKLDYDDERSKAIGTEFCGTSITSDNRHADRIAAALPFNPHIRYGRADQRGYVSFRLDAQALHAQLRVLDNVLDPGSGISTAARFVVEAGRPGAQPA